MKSINLRFLSQAIKLMPKQVPNNYQNTISTLLINLMKRWKCRINYCSIKACNMQFRVELYVNLHLIRICVKWICRLSGIYALNDQDCISKAENCFFRVFLEAILGNFALLTLKNLNSCNFIVFRLQGQWTVKPTTNFTKIAPKTCPFSRLPKTR